MTETPCPCPVCNCPMIDIIWIDVNLFADPPRGKVICQCAHCPHCTADYSSVAEAVRKCDESAK